MADEPTWQDTLDQIDHLVGVLSECEVPGHQAEQVVARISSVEKDLWRQRTGLHKIYLRAAWDAIEVAEMVAEVAGLSLKAAIHDLTKEGGIRFTSNPDKLAGSLSARGIDLPQEEQ